MATATTPKLTAFGALPRRDGGVRFQLWAPSANHITLVLHDGHARGAHPVPRDSDGVFDLIVDGVEPGDRYSYRIDDGEPRPDPASRFQPDGVHGPSQVIDPDAFEWSDRRWGGRSLHDLIIYELHLGTFTREGTFAAATARLAALRDLGVTAVEIMPVADFAGARNWGYDGVCLYAPSRAYGRPDDFRRFVDAAHRFGISVILDVVYNHLGPEGAYLREFDDGYFTDRHATPWGAAVDLDGPIARRFIVDNAAHWVREYHLDGLRLDATHALIESDEGATVREIIRTVREASRHPVLVFAEDHRNMAAMIEDPAHGGWGVDGVWADDFHHVMRSLLAGDEHGYYADFEGTTAELARTIRQGWLFTGQRSEHLGKPRGTDASHVPMSHFVVCLQNHDQIGNRAMGDRLHANIAADAWRAASAVLLTAPMTPLLFMGQEWAAGTPFQFFTDLSSEIGQQVTEGRRGEFSDFPEFADDEARHRIPDPQAETTFDASRLRWEEREEPAHAAALALYRALIALRLDHPALGGSDETAGDAYAPDADSLVMRRSDGDAHFLVVARLRGAGPVDTGPDGTGDREWEAVLTTEDPLYALDPAPPRIDLDGGAAIVSFTRPGAVILKAR